MNLYNFLTSSFNHFIAMFPGPLQAVATLLILIGLLALLVALLRHHIIFILLIIILLPFIIPVVVGLFHDFVAFGRYLLELFHFTN